MALGDKYSQDMDGLAGFGFLISALGEARSGERDKGNLFPASDAEDLSRGARFIPGEVTEARRRGDQVDFFVGCNYVCCWYWQMPDGSRIYHWEKSHSDHLKEQHDGECPNCGNTHVNGGTVSAEELG